MCGWRRPQRVITFRIGVVPPKGVGVGNLGFRVQGLGLGFGVLGLGFRVQGFG